MEKSLSLSVLCKGGKIIINCASFSPRERPLLNTRCMTIPLMSSVDTSVSLSFLAYLNQMAPIARFIDKFVPLLHALQEYMSGGRDYIVWAL